jgi:hypothetical protein
MERQRTFGVSQGTANATEKLNHNGMVEQEWKDLLHEMPGRGSKRNDGSLFIKIAAFFVGRGNDDSLFCLNRLKWRVLKENKGLSFHLVSEIGQ